jgi:hypothetical protein
MNAEAQIRKGRKFDQVIDGAKAVFLREGFEGASVDEIARDAGCLEGNALQLLSRQAAPFPRRSGDGMRAPVRGGNPAARLRSGR